LINIFNEQSQMGSILKRPICTVHYLQEQIITAAIMLPNN